MVEDQGIQFKRQAKDYKEDLLNQLYQVIDPELGIDIVNLGLIYEIDLDELGNCRLMMTLTTPGCPLAAYIDNDIRFALADIEAIQRLELQLTFTPAWTLDRISRFGKIALGIK